MAGFKLNMKRSKSIYSVIALAVLAGGLCASPVLASKGDLVTKNVKPKAADPVVVTLGKAEVLNLPSNVSDVLVADPSVIDVQAIQSNKLYVVGLAVGNTNVIILDAKGNVLKKMDFHVAQDIDAIQSFVDRLFPDEQVKVSSVHKQIVLTGQVSNPEASSKVTNVVGRYVADLQGSAGKTADQLVSNLLEVRGEQQVLLKVKILEAKRSVLKELGVNTRANDPDELAVTTLFGNSQLSSRTSNGNSLSFGGGDGVSITGQAVGIATGYLDTNITGIGLLGVSLNALEDQNLVNVLAEPNLTAVSGQQAGFLAGGEFPVPTGRDQNGNITIEFREFGVSLNFKPIVLSDKRINLQMNTEVSSLDSSNAVTLADIKVPGLDIRRAETTVELPSGGSLMIAGLLQSEAAKSMASLPGVSKTPILGDLLKSDSFRRDESELIVLVTGYLVEPFSHGGDAMLPDKNGQNQPIDKRQPSEMSKIFSDNMRKKYPVKDLSVLKENGPYGYLLD